MTGERVALAPELAAAYVRELSTGVRAVFVLDDGSGPDAARTLAAQVGHGVVITSHGSVVVAGGCVVVVIDPGSLVAPTALDAVALLGVRLEPPQPVESPSQAVLSAVRELLAVG